MSLYRKMTPERVLDYLSIAKDDLAYVDKTAKFIPKGDIENSIAINKARKQIVAIISELNTKYIRALMDKAGIPNTQHISGDYTLEEIGKVCGLTRERIRQIESHAIKRLKHPKIARKFKYYLDDTVNMAV